MARERLQFVISTAGIVAVGIAAATALGGHRLVTLALLAFAAPALWVCGGWVLPGTSDAYYRRVRRAWRDWEVAVGVSRDRYASLRLDGLFRAQAITPPPGRDALHTRLLELLADPHEGVSPRELFALSGELEALPDDEASGAYAAAWRELRAGSRADYTHAVEREEAETAALVARLERLRAPRAVSSDHARLVAAFREYGVAGRGLAAAWSTRDTDVVDAASARLVDAEHGIDAAHAAIAGRVGWHVRWPVG